VGFERAPRSVGFGSLSSRPGPDVIVLLATLLVTLSLQFFPSTERIPAFLRLSWAVVTGPYPWQLLSYPFVGFGGGGLGFLIELFVVYMFANDLFGRLGRRGFWTVLLVATPTAALAALGADALRILTLGPGWTRAPFVLIQGQHMLLAVLITAFAVVMRDATIYLFFVLPVPARLMVWLGILIAFLYFLPTLDLAGFVGICTATAATWWWLGRSRGRGRVRLGARLRLWWAEQRLRRLRRRSKLRVVKGPKPPTDLTVN
jgi:hypothetical protein